MSELKWTNPQSVFAHEDGKLELYHAWSDQMEVWDDEADDLGYTDQWQRDSYRLAKTTRFMDEQRAEAEMQRQIAGNKL